MRDERNQPTPPVCLHCLIMAHVRALAKSPDYRQGDFREAFDQIARAVADFGMFFGDEAMRSEFYRSFVEMLDRHKAEAERRQHDSQHHAGAGAPALH